VQDAFMQFWRAAETEQANELWAAYCAAQEQYERYLMKEQSAPNRGRRRGGARSVPTLCV
jgi:hypothetical protein